MRNLFKKLNSKIVIIGIVSTVVVILCVVGVVIGVNSKNSKESNKTKNDKKVELETTSIKETQTNKNTEESMDTALSTENVTEEAATEKAGENVTEEAKEEENNVAENDASAGNNNSSNSQQNYNEPDTPQEDHIVYKSDGSIDLNESYWVNRKDAINAIRNSVEAQNFIQYTRKKYNCTHAIKNGMSYAGKSDIWNVYSFTYYNFCDECSFRLFGYFNGSEFVEK